MAKGEKPILSVRIDQTLMDRLERVMNFRRFRRIGI
jgi:hypothetical protein